MVCTTTDGLKTVMLDHVPEWEESRRQAFLTGSYRGGQLHLLKDVDGAYPKFTARFFRLNAQQAERFRVATAR